jgi:hypothetical protein
LKDNFLGWKYKGGAIGHLTTKKNAWLFGLKVAALLDRPHRPSMSNDDRVFSSAEYDTCYFLLNNNFLFIPSFFLSIFIFWRNIFMP